MNRPAHVFIRAASAVTVLSVAHAQGMVWVVDDDGGAGVDFTDLPAAVAGAANGDTLLVFDGDYSAFELDAKGLSVIAEVGNAPTTQGITIKNLGANQRALVRGFETGNPVGDMVVLQDNDGAVRIEGSSLRGKHGFNAYPSGPDHPLGYDGALIENSANVAFVRCTIEAGEGASLWDPSIDDMGPGGAGVRSSDSNVAFFNTTVTGGRGGGDVADDLGLSGTYGGAGFNLSSGTVFASGSTVSGGQGGTGGTAYLWGGCGNGGSGGTGAIVGGTSELRYIDSTFEGGPGGWGTSYYGCSNGNPGQDMVGSATQHAGPAKGFVSPSPLREGELASFTMFGAPGDAGVLIFSGGAGYFPLPDFSGVLLTSATPSILFGGVVPASGELDVAISGPALSASVQSIVLQVQSAFVKAEPAATMGPASPLVIIDGSL